ncbi:MAG: DMT family transporter [Acidiferrobacterales bacterium]
MPSPVARGALLGRGHALALVTAIFFGGITTLARLAYEAGSNPVTVVATRFLLAAVAIALLMLVLRRSYRLPRRAWPPTALVSLAWFIGAGGYLSSVFFIPVGLAALVLYTFPLMIIAAQALFEQAHVKPSQVAPFPIAFAGLMIALGPVAADLDGRGVALALLGAAGIAASFIWSKRLVVDYDLFAVTMYVNAGGALLIVAAVLFFGVAAPHGAHGWIGLGGVTFCYVTAMLMQFAAIRYIGPATTAMIFNLEPLISIGAAALLLGERLTMLQLSGAALVIGALVLSTRSGS